MALPYNSSRTGRFQWMMQRVSAILLVGLAGSHFALQHFSAEAVSTGLTVSARMNDPFWQGYYGLFVVLGLYHGVNGVVGIIQDYAPKPIVRGILATILWTMAAWSGFVGLGSLYSPRTVAEVKEYYAENGFADGTATGPGLPIPVAFNTSDEIRELHMFAFYLEHHTYRTDKDKQSIKTIFGSETAKGHGSPDHPEGDNSLAAIGGMSFQNWALAQLPLASQTR